MVRFLLLIALVSFNSISALTLKDKIVKGAVGDYIITKQNRSCSLIRIHTLTSSRLIIEEISFPESATPKDPEIWLKNDAKGHTSWSIIEIDLSNSALKSCYSFSKNSHLVLSSDDSFLIKIIDLPFAPIAESEMRRIGPAPKEGFDTRKIWNPPLYFEGKKEVSPKFTPVRITYPKDGSPLSGKRIELFFNSSDATFPFPYWGQVTDDSEAALKFRVINSGRNLPSPKKSPL